MYTHLSEWIFILYNDKPKQDNQEARQTLVLNQSCPSPS